MTRWAAKYGIRLKDCEWMSSPESFNIEVTDDIIPTNEDRN